MRRVLIISYYWPPGGGAGVQRWLKFAKYLRDFGWEPVVYTPQNPEYPAFDPSLEKDVPQGIEVLKTLILEPYLLYKIFSGRSCRENIQAGFISENKRPGIAEKISAWIRGNLFIPDARCFWIGPSVKFLTKWLKKNHVDAIVSTGPPHSMHMIAHGIKRKRNIPWLADFRDPWTQIDFYNKLRLTSWANAKHKKLEQKVLKTADRVVTVSPTCSEGLKTIYSRNIHVITNGFDPADFGSLPPFRYDTFSITHLGSLNADRNPHKLWEVLAQLVEQREFFATKLAIRLIGKTDISVIDSLEENGLTRYLEKTDYLPHDQALVKASQSAVLLLPLNNTPNVMGITTGKIFEYLALKRPVLAIGPEDGDAASILLQTQSGQVAAFDDQNKMTLLLLKWEQAFLNNKLELNPRNTDQYSRKELTKALSSILQSMIDPGSDPE